MPIEIAAEDLRSWLKPRPADSHKGDFGCVGILGGAPGMAGAALLAGRAALWLGAGRVYCGLLDARIAIDHAAPELMLTTPERVMALAAPACLVVGPGLGQSDAARDGLTRALATALPLLLDADALNLVAADPALADAVGDRGSPTLLTPHPGEAGRLLGRAAADVQRDRAGAVIELMKRFRCGVVLKGSGSLIRFPEAETWLNGSGNPGMAAPGMGDVLSGMIAALVAQGLALEQAAVAGVYLHGAAADAAVEDGLGPIGLSASEVARAARRLLNELVYGVSESGLRGAQKRLRR
jgi:hydroxyethylthiazole kinase-like uncharacterized protein yjeF